MGGVVLGGQVKVSEAQEAFERALELSPNDPEVLIEYAQFKWMIGAVAGSNTLAAHVLALNPNSWGVHYSLAFLRRLSGDHSAAAEAFRRSVELNPTNFATYMELGLEEVILGDFSEAVTHLRIGEELAGELTAFQAAILAYSNSRMSRAEETMRLLDEYQRALSVSSGGGLFFARTWMSLAIGDHQQVLESLEGVASGGGGTNLRIHEFRVNAWNDPILDQPEFVEVRSRLGFRE